MFKHRLQIKTNRKVLSFSLIPELKRSTKLHLKQSYLIKLKWKYYNNARWYSKKYLVKTIIPSIHIKRQRTKLLCCRYCDNQRIPKWIIIVFKNPNFLKEAISDRRHLPNKIKAKRCKFLPKNLTPLKTSKRIIKSNVDIGKISKKKIHDKDKSSL